MSEQKGQLRGVLFGGFRRQDVLNCLETMNQEYEQSLEALRSQLAGEEQARRELEQTVAEQGAQSTENQRLSKALEQSETALAAARTELDRKSEQLSQLEQDCAAMKAEVERLRPAAGAYEEIKDRTAGIELDAHRRAQTIVREAEAQAAKLRADMEQWLGRVEQGYDLLRTDMDATVSHAANELDRVRKSLDGVTEDFNAYDRRLAELIKAYREGTQ